jgi:hypothetical protein
VALEIRDELSVVVLASVDTSLADVAVADISLV